MAVPVQAVFGLGNPGRRYDATRHNIGFEVADELARRGGVQFKSSWRLRAKACSWPAGSGHVWLVKPQQYMNLSGLTLSRFKRRRGMEPAAMLVVVDDVELPLGQLRLRKQGGAGGHNGLRSIIRELGSDAFPRLRIGVGGGETGRDLTGHVLGRFRPQERPLVDETVARAADAVECVLEEGVDVAMNRYNVKR
jgi:PTH1 family peptidyl-tRNA hydrolase